MSLLMTRNRIFAVTREARVLRENTESRKSEGGEGGARWTSLKSTLQKLGLDHHLPNRICGFPSYFGSLESTLWLM